MISEEKRQLGYAFSDRFDRETLTKTITVGSSATQFSFSSTKTGYTPLTFNVSWGQSTTTIGGVESSTLSNLSGTKITVSGYLKQTDSTSRSVPITCQILWVSTGTV